MPNLIAHSSAENVRWEKMMELLKEKFSTLKQYEKHNEEFKPDERLKRVLLKSAASEL